jgi:hypothetical protein
MQVSPKTQIIIAIVVALLYAGANGTVGLPLGIPPEWGAYIASWSHWLIGVYLVIAPFVPAFSSSARGPLAPPDAPVVAAAARLAALPPDASAVSVQGAKAEVTRAVERHAA